MTPQKTLFRCLVLAANLLAAGPVLASADFSQCVSALEHRAVSKGIPAALARRALGSVSRSERVVELDRRQPEFSRTFAHYLRPRVTEERVARGRELLAAHRELLQRLERRYGVPAQYLVAFWGLETNYGSYLGRMPILDSLTTLACDRRRGSYFGDQVVAALRILNEDAVSRDRLRGSWAGAMGNFQFMPSVFLSYAVDYDGDGHRDLWGSVPDAMASAANFVQALGWKPGYRWGREVRLPKGFDYARAGLDRRRPLSAWRRMGVTEADGRPLPRADIEAALIVPAGHRGPAFLVYHNFRVIMGWNRSQFYALAVGHLADRIAGAGRLRQPPPDDAPDLSRDDVRRLQSLLNAQGYDSGEPDGILGPSTRDAVRAFQTRHGLIADGYPTQAVFRRLGISLAKGD